MIPPSFTERLCLGIYLREEPKRLFLMLGVYVDESGTHGGTAHTIMAGVVATVEQWAALERRWATIFNPDHS
jgi:hypothetical protein